MTTTTKARPLLRWLAAPLAPAIWLERARGRRRLALIALYLLIAGALGVWTWRASRLWGLPDIGDPFDTGPLMRLSVPDERNAFVLYLEARGRLKRSPLVERRVENSPYAYPAAGDVEGREYIEANVPALEIWRRGTERPDAMLVAPRDLTILTSLAPLNDHRHFVRLALLMASKAIAEGDLAGAWLWYRAVLRSSRHAGMHNPAIGALVGASEYGMATSRIIAWAADPRVDPAMLRRALAAVREANAMTTPASEVLKIEYLGLKRSLADPEGMFRAFTSGDEWPGGIDPRQWTNHLPGYWRTRWWLANEPERARFLAQLAFANWLAFCDEPPDRRPPLVGSSARPAQVFDAQAPGLPPGAPSPREIAGRLDASFLISWLDLSYNFPRGLDRDRAQQAALVVALAERLYAREHGGQAPATLGALVGPYLDRLPDGYDASQPSTILGPSGTSP